MATGFNYPPRSSNRRHGPQGYASYDSFRPWLRDEFAFRCVYCLIREQWGRITGDFHLDHYVPQLIDPRGRGEQPSTGTCFSALLAIYRRGAGRLPTQ